MPATTASATTTIHENQPNCHLPLATPQASNENVPRCEPISAAADSILFLPRARSAAAPKYRMTRYTSPLGRTPDGQRAGVGEEVHGQGVSTIVQTNAMRFDKRSRVARSLNYKLRDRGIDRELE
jgi:hypothetical protein